MLYSIYRIQCHDGCYVGHTRDFNYRMGSHYASKVDGKESGRHIVISLRATCDDDIIIEELGLYEVSCFSEILCIERYMINEHGGTLNMLMRDKGRTIYHDDVKSFVSSCYRVRDTEPINDDIRYNYMLKEMIDCFRSMSLEDRECS